jgi:hypothetical protein
MTLRSTHLLLVIAAAGGWLAVSQRALKRDVARLEARVATLREELEEQRTLIRMTAAVAATLPRATPAAALPAPAAAAEAGDPKALIPPDEGAEEIARFETGFGSDPLDPSWANDSEQHLTTSLAALAGSNNSFLNVSCRGSVCRAEIRLTDGPHVAEFVEKSSTGSFWKGLRASRSQDSPSDHSVVVTMFFVKEGHELPTRLGPT